MKKIFIIFAALLMTASIFLPQQVSAQAPEKMSYQAVIRNSSDELVKNTQIGIKISILKASASGAAVYVETQTPTTNINGLASIEIGAGTVVSGNFTTIDWANGTYFIKTETDPSGGTNYSITVTNQLLSVPYALHAKSAETITGGVVETDPVFKDSQAYKITSADITNLGNLSGVNTGDQDLSALATKTALIDSIAQLRSKIKTYKVGDFVYGGVVFYVDETGQHGLVCAKSDQSDTARWYAGSESNTMAKGRGIMTGAANTSIIIASQGIGDGKTYAARICNEFYITIGGKGYGGWFLPSIEELKLMYANRAIIDSTALAHGGKSFNTAGDYWSSTENIQSQSIAHYVRFSDGYPFINGLKVQKKHVRAVRAF